MLARSRLRAVAVDGKTSRGARRWSCPQRKVRDVTFSEDAATSRTGSGPANLATIRAAIIAALKTSDTCTSPKADATTPPHRSLRLHGLD
jgi:hypothetical protein